MALKTVMLRHKITGKKTELEKLRARAEELKTREAELEKDIDAANTQEEQDAVEAAIAQHEADTAQNAADTETLEAEISGLEAELADAEEKEKAPADKHATGTAGNNERGKNTMPVTIRARMSNAERRASIRESLAIAEVRDFYSAIAGMARRDGAISNTSFTIPEIIVDRIQALIGDYGTVINEVDRISVGGTARVVLDGADPEAVWVEMDGAISGVNASFSKVEMDGFKCAGYVAVPNDVIDDSFVNLADYVERKLARAIAKSVDKAILTGTGSTGKQLVGIIPSLKSENIVSTSNGFNLGEIIAPISKVDTGEEALGEIIMVMKRSTFYNRFVKGMIAVDSNGRYVAPNVANPNVAGFRVVFSQYMAADKVLIGDYKRYMITDRAGIKLEESKDVKFIEDQTVFKGLVRMDGKPLHVDGNGKTTDWVLVTITDEYTGELDEITVQSAAGTASGDTAITMSGYTPGAGESYVYKVATGTAPSIEYGHIPDYTWTAWDGTSDITAATGKKITIVSVDTNGRAVAAGNATVTAHA